MWEASVPQHMCLTIPQSIKDFYDDHLPNVGSRKRHLLSLFTASLLMSPSKRTLTALGQAVLTEQRVKSGPQKFFSRKRFRSKENHRTMIQAVLEEITRTCGSAGDWILLIDGTASRLGFTKIENATKYKKRANAPKGTPAKHTCS